MINNKIGAITCQDNSCTLQFDQDRLQMTKDRGKNAFIKTFANAQELEEQAKKVNFYNHGVRAIYRNTRNLDDKIKNFKRVCRVRKETLPNGEKVFKRVDGFNGNQDNDKKICFSCLGHYGKLRRNLNDVLRNNNIVGDRRTNYTNRLNTITGYINSLSAKYADLLESGDVIDIPQIIDLRTQLENDPKIIKMPKRQKINAPFFYPGFINPQFSNFIPSFNDQNRIISTSKNEAIPYSFDVIYEAFKNIWKKYKSHAIMQNEKAYLALFNNIKNVAKNRQLYLKDTQDLKLFYYILLYWYDKKEHNRLKGLDFEDTAEGYTEDDRTEAKKCIDYIIKQYKENSSKSKSNIFDIPNTFDDIVNAFSDAINNSTAFKNKALNKPNLKNIFDNINDIKALDVKTITNRYKGLELAFVGLLININGTSEFNSFKKNANFPQAWVKIIEETSTKLWEYKEAKSQSRNFDNFNTFPGFGNMFNYSSPYNYFGSGIITPIPNPQSGTLSPYLFENSQ